MQDWESSLQFSSVLFVRKGNIFLVVYFIIIFSTLYIHFIEYHFIEFTPPECYMIDIYSFDLTVSRNTRIIQRIEICICKIPEHQDMEHRNIYPCSLFAPYCMATTPNMHGHNEWKWVIHACRTVSDPRDISLWMYQVGIPHGGEDHSVSALEPFFCLECFLKVVLCI